MAKSKKDGFKSCCRFSWNLVTYLSEPQLQEVITSLKTTKILRHYLYILHYKDTAEVHFHVSLVFTSKVFYYDLIPYFGGYFDSEHKAINTLCQPNYRPDLTYNYFLHRGADKAQYEVSELVSDDLSFFETYKGDLKVDKVGNAMQALMQGHSIIDCINSFGRDFVIYYPRYKELLTDLGYIFDTKDKYFYMKGDV